MKTLKYLFSFMKGKRLLFITVVFTTVLGAATVQLPDIFVGKLVDHVLYKETTITLIERILHITADTGTVDMLLRYILGVMVVCFFSILLRYLSHMGFLRTGLHIGKSLHRVLYEKMQTLDVSFFAKTPSGELITNLTSDMNHVKGIFVDLFYSVVREFFFILFNLSLLFYYEWKTTLIMVTFFPIIIVLNWVIFKRTRVLHLRLRKKLTEMSNYVNENIGAYRIVKAFAREDYENGRLRSESEQYRDLAVDNTKQYLFFQTPLIIATHLMRIFALCFSAVMTIQGRMTVGELTVFNTLSLALQSPITNIPSLINQFQQAMVSAQKVYDVAHLESEIENNAEMHGDMGKIRTIEFRDVCLDLEGHRILDHINLKIRMGKTLAIMGPTGAGKTILISLLIRLYDPTEGAIYVNGVDIRDIELDRLRGEIAVATQDVFLFSDTIDSNIAFSDLNMPTEMVKQVAETAQAAEFIEKLTDGYDTVIGERGIGLSGGQRQRIALARAVAKNASVIVLDDTTSAVDMETEVNILHELQKITNKIKIIVAQRITSVIHADEIIVLQNGRITERGNHDQLLAQNGYYAEVYRISREGEEETVHA